MKDYVRFVGLDVETTGLKADKGDRITELALVVDDYNPATLDYTRRKVWSSLINPERSISEKASELTQITAAMVASKPPFKHFAPTVAKILRSADCLVAHNMNFDAVFIATELALAGESINDDTDTFCTMQSGRFATALGNVPKLTDLCWSLGVEFDDTAAHRADYDTIKMMDCLGIGIKRGLFKPDCLF